MLPVRCYTCNALVAHLPYHSYVKEGASPKEALEACGVERMCCRRIFLGHVDLTEDILAHPNTDRVLDDGGTVLKRLAVAPRVVGCE